VTESLEVVDPNSQALINRGKAWESARLIWQ